MTDHAVTSPEVVDLARRVQVVHDPALDAGYPAGRPARVRILLRDGSERSAAADLPRGDAGRAFSRTELAAKSARLLTHAFGDAGCEVLTAVHELGARGRARGVGSALRRAAGQLR